MKTPKQTIGSNTRLAMVAIPAAAVTLAIAIGMKALIHFDNVTLDEDPQRVLATITPTIDTPDVKPKKRTPPERIEVANPPPAMQRKRSGDIHVDLPVPTLHGVEPDAPTATPVAFTAISAAAMLPREVEAISPPRPVYPRAMLAQGISGSCEVLFDLTAQGEPFNIMPKCSHIGFEKESRRAISKTRFIPKVENGQRVAQMNVVYPLKYQIQE